jgi:hypothetical protein
MKQKRPYRRFALVQSQLDGMGIVSHIQKVDIGKP